MTTRMPSTKTRMLSTTTHGEEDEDDDEEDWSQSR